MDFDWKALSRSPKDMGFSESKASAVQKSFQTWLAPGYGPFRFDYNADRLEALASERAAEWDRVGKASFLTLDEQREAVGYGPAPRNALFGKDGAARLERRYSPSQPRVPAGSGRESGRWTSGGGGGSATGNVSFLGDALSSANSGVGEGDIQSALNVDPHVANDAGNSFVEAGGRNYDLSEEEGGPAGEHSIEEHVGKSESYLLRRARELTFAVAGPIKRTKRVGSFPSLEADNKLVNSTLDRNKDTVDQLARGLIDGETTVTIEAMFDSPTGKEAYASTFWGQYKIRATNGVAVVIRYDPRAPRGFRIITAYPIYR